VLFNIVQLQSPEHGHSLKNKARTKDSNVVFQNMQDPTPRTTP